MRLWEIDARIEEIEAALSSLEDDTYLEILEAELDAEQRNLAVKLDSCAALIQALEATATARKAEADRLAKLAKSDQGRAEKLRAFLLHYFRTRGHERLDTPRYRLSVTQNGGCQPLEISLGVGELPERFRRSQVVADTDEIRKALQSGEELQWARLGERGVSLRIR